MIKIPDDVIFKAFKVLMDPASGALLAEKVIKITDDDSFKVFSSKIETAFNGMDSTLCGNLKSFFWNGYSMEWILPRVVVQIFFYGMDSTRSGSLKRSAENFNIYTHKVNLIVLPYMIRCG